MPRTADQAYAELIQRFRDYSLLGSCSSVLGWDERTYMPREGSAHRAEQVALLARMTHQMLTDPEISRLLGELDGSALTGDSDRAANVREIRRTYDRAVKLPEELVEELARTTTRAQQVWQEARQANDFPAFRPWLDKIVRLKREEAQPVGHQETPYDALLDEYEPGAKTAEVTRLFAELRAELTPLIAAIAASGRRAPTDILAREYPVERQQALGQSAAASIGFDFTAGRLDVTTHPFCSGIGPGDCRLTT